MNGVTISPCGLYRYELRRDWGSKGKRALFVMLNPSTADAQYNDPTIRRCIGFAREWGYDGMEVGNLFAYRSTDPKQLKDIGDPVGPDNDRHLRDMAARASIVIAAWGAFPKAAFAPRVVEVSRMLLESGGIHCLGNTKAGDPRHPLYVHGATAPELYIRRVRSEKRC